MLELEGKPVIQHVYERILHCRNIDRIIVATSDQSRDDPIANLFGKLGVDVFRGSETDPLDRYYRAATQYSASSIVRIMADCPLVDPLVVDQVIATFFSGNYDVCYLAGEFPTGLDTVVFSYAALEKCWHSADIAFQREHVTPYMTSHPDIFRVGVYKGFVGLYHHRWVMDHQADYDFIKAVYGALYRPGELFVSKDILKLLVERPILLQINAHIPRDEAIRAARKKEMAGRS